MNYKLAPIVLASLAFVATQALAIDAFPNQPKMSAAYNKLSEAMAQVEKSRAGKPVKHKNGAIVDLTMAKTFLEDAAKNKGSYKSAAIALVDQALQELQATPANDEHTDQALGLIKKAMDEVNRGARAGKH